MRNCHGGESNRWAKVQDFSKHSFMKPLEYFHIMSLVDSLALWNEFKVNNNLDIGGGKKKRLALSSFVTPMCKLSLDCLYHSKTLYFFRASPP
jgi:hypothetical protein